eukprot:TRINITY_DN292_c0_g1_i1.p1 TRINITY_DN292_c0_g1~~TRINITY_DN292_c0_g1_i1.p1  ORF type:complete len:169 (-),score=7.41 TRINITY_DN292_c0_g1_i1:107-613(-)
MSTDKATAATAVGVMVCVMVCCALPLHITSTVLGFLEYNNCHTPSPNNTCSCDVTDPSGLNVAQYLIGLGLAGITQVVLSMFLIGLNVLNPKPAFMVLFVGVSVAAALFGFSWFIVGAVVLFRSNIDCINSHTTHVVYAVVMWCFSALDICNTGKSSHNQSTQNQLQV